MLAGSSHKGVSSRYKIALLPSGCSATVYSVCPRAAAAAQLLPGQTSPPLGRRHPSGGRFPSGKTAGSPPPGERFPSAIGKGVALGRIGELPGLLQIQLPRQLGGLRRPGPLAAAAPGHPANRPSRHRAAIYFFIFPYLPNGVASGSAAVGLHGYASLQVRHTCRMYLVET